MGKLSVFQFHGIYPLRPISRDMHYCAMGCYRDPVTLLFYDRRNVSLVHQRFQQDFLGFPFGPFKDMLFNSI